MCVCVLYLVNALADDGLADDELGLAVVVLLGVGQGLLRGLLISRSDKRATIRVHNMVGHRA